MKVNRIETLDLESIYKVLNSKEITEAQKTKFVLSNSTNIKKIMKRSIDDKDFKLLMKNRAIKKFRPIKNSYTKIGDKMILATALSLQPSKLPRYIKNVTQMMKDSTELDFLPKSTLEMIKTYVYRHGSKDELVTFLDYELKTSKDTVKSLYSTFEYYSGGVADYFIRPIHRMDNKTLVKMFNVVTDNLENAQISGQITSDENAKIAKWTLVKIYEIQNNSKLLNAIKTYNVLK